MKSLILSAIVAVAGVASASYGVIGISKPDVPFKDLNSFGLPTKIEHISIIDSAESGSVKAYVGRTIQIPKQYSTTVNEITSNYAVHGTTITGPWIYFGSMGNVPVSDDLEMPLVSSSSGKKAYGCGSLMFVTDETSTGAKDPTTVVLPTSGSVGSYMVKEAKNQLQSFHFNDDKSAVIDGYIEYVQNRYYSYSVTYDKSGNPTYVPVSLVDSAYTNTFSISGSMAGINRDSVTLPVMKDSAAKPDTMLRNITYDVYTYTNQVVTKEVNIIDASYTDGKYEASIADSNIFVIPNGYIRFEGSQFTNGTARAAIIFDK